MVFATCSHTRNLEDPAPPSAAAATEPVERHNNAPKKKAVPAGSVPLVSDPLQMLTPDGRDELRQSLRKRDLLSENASIETALRKFQKQEGLPETGMPDDETLMKLNLDPKKVAVRSKPAS